MKIDYDILSSDNKPLYIDFWPSVSKVWKQKFGITPILASVSYYINYRDRTYGCTPSNISF